MQGFLGTEEKLSLREIEERLKWTYCEQIGFEYMVLFSFFLFFFFLFIFFIFFISFPHFSFLTPQIIFSPSSSFITAYLQQAAVQLAARANRAP